jgi:hypothetical protein
VNLSKALFLRHNASGAGPPSLFAIQQLNQIHKARETPHFGRA